MRGPVPNRGTVEAGREEIVVVATRSEYTERMAFFVRRAVPKLPKRSSRWRLTGASAFGVVVGLTLADASQAAVVFSNGFESGNTRDWDYRLNPEGLRAVTAPEPVLAGTYSLRAELTAERVWENGIFRTEVQHQPAAERVADGAETYFAWSIYLPKALPAGDYQLGYFETSTTYQQVFSLHAEGADLYLNVNRNSPDSPSRHPGMLEVGKWHRIVYHVKWSSDNTVGFVSLWWDGVKLVDQLHGKTYLDDPALVQLGLLKDPPEPPEAIVLYLDEVMEGDSYADVSLGIAETVPMPVPTVTDTPSLVAPPGTDPTATTTTAPVPPAAPPPAAPAPAGTNNEGGCSVSRRTGGGPLGWAAALGLTLWLTRRVRRASRL